MRRLLSIAVVGAIALVSSSALAQRGMGGGARGGFGGARVSSGFRSGPSMGARGFAGPGRGFTARPGFVPRGGSHIVVPPGGRALTFNFHRARGFGNGFFPNCVGFNCGNCFGFNCGNFFFHGHHHHGFFFGSPFFGSPFFGTPFLNTWGYIPGFDYPYDYNQPQAQPVVVQSSDNTSDMQLAMQIQRLSDEISDLRGEQAMQRLQNRPALTPGQSLSVPAPAAATTFVFRDGRRVSAENYAISGETLWVLTEHAAKKYSLADLDRAATQQVNAASGIELHLPEPAKH